LRAHLEALGAYGAQLAPGVVDQLAAYAERTRTAQVAACKAHDRGELDDAIYATHLACVSNAKTALVTVRDVLGATTRDRLPDAVTAMRSLPAVERCSSEVVPPPDEVATRVAENGAAVARARVLALAIDPRAIDAAATAARSADAIGYPRQIGRAALVHGLALLLQQQVVEAGIAFDRASRAALEADDPATAIESLARGVYATATSNRGRVDPSAVVAKLDLALALAKGLRGDAAFARALLYNNLGTVHLGGDREAARRWFADADRVRPPMSHATFELASIYGNLAILELDRARRDALFAREGTELEQALGAEHSMTLDARNKAAMFVEHPQRSADLLRDACALLSRLHAHLRDRVEQCSYELAWLAEERGDVREATGVLARIAEGDSPEAMLAAGYRALLAGEPADAAREMTALAERLERASGFWLRWRVVDAHLLAALANDLHGQRDRASAHAERALAALDALGEFTKVSFVQRRRGRLLAMLAAWNAGDVEARVAGALEWAQRAGGYEARVAALTRSR
jgi:tetratricopeptide (TPR) repeat protein